MNEGCKEVLRETLAVSPALSITAYISNCLYSRRHTHTKKRKWLPCSFTAQGEVGHRIEVESDLAVKLCVELKDNQCFSLLRFLPATVRAAVHGPELTKLLLGKYHPSVRAASETGRCGTVHCPERAEGFDWVLLCIVSREDIYKADSGLTVKSKQSNASSTQAGCNLEDLSKLRLSLYSISPCQAASAADKGTKSAPLPNYC